MSRVLWRIAAVTRTYSADDQSGTGAKIAGGRWNSEGKAVVYCSESIAPAVLETLVHLRSAGLPANRYLVRIDVPDDIWNARILQTAPPVGWDAEPAGLPSVKAGDAWLAGCTSVLMAAPSIVVPDEWNVLINPVHPDTARLGATMVKGWQYDPRCF